jgi:hypothetical protein
LKKRDSYASLIRANALPPDHLDAVAKDLPSGQIFLPSGHEKSLTTKIQRHEAEISDAFRLHSASAPRLTVSLRFGLLERCRY